MSNNLLYCVLHTQLQKSRIKNIKETWGKDKNLIFYSDYNDLNNNIFKVSNRTDYASGQEKQINVFTLLNYILDSYEWYIFCDNDTFINTNLLEKKIYDLNTEKVHGRVINSWPVDKNLYYVSGGAGFIMHNSLVKKIFPKLKQNYDIEYSDVSLGINLKEMKIDLEDNDSFHPREPEFYNIKDNNIKNYISFHYVTEFSMMNHLNLLCSDNN